MTLFVRTYFAGGIGDGGDGGGNGDHIDASVFVAIQYLILIVRRHTVKKKERYNQWQARGNPFILDRECTSKPVSVVAAPKA